MQLRGPVDEAVQLTGELAKKLRKGDSNTSKVLNTHCQLPYSIRVVDIIPPGNAIWLYFCYICLCVSLVRALTFQSVGLETSLLTCRYIFRIPRSRLYIKVIE